MYNNKTIKINYTAFLYNDWKDIVTFHLECLKQSNLINIADEINFFAYPQNYELLQLLQKYKYEDKIKIIWNEKNEYEYQAINDLIQNPFDYNLYFHSKGSSKNKSDYLKNNIKEWNIYMSNYTMANYKQCLQMLEDNDCVGVDFHFETPFPHYHGNFWWSRKSHLQKLKDNKFFQHFRDNRMFYEMVLCSVSCRVVSLCESGKSLYMEQFTMNKWKTQPKTYDITKNRKCVVIALPIREYLNVNWHTKEIDDTDFIIFSEENPVLSIILNWKLYQFPQELKYLNYEQKKKMLKSLLFKYLDYDQITYVEQYNDDEVKHKVNNSNTVIVKDGKLESITVLNANNVKQKIFQNELAKNMLECKTEYEALKKTLKSEKMDLNIVNI